MTDFSETIAALARREAELYSLMVSASDHLSQRDQSLQAALENLAAQVSTVRAEQKTHEDSAVAQAVAISNHYTEYQNLVTRVREIVERKVPVDATVIVVSKGDNELLKLDGRNAWHFPQNEWGVYAGYYPACSAEAITQLEELRAKGGQYLVFPQTALWWLDHYAEFKEHLNTRYPVVSSPEDTCLIYSLKTLLRVHKPRAAHAARGQRKTRSGGRTLSKPVAKVKS